MRDKPISSEIDVIEERIKSEGPTKPDRPLDPWVEADDLDIQHFQSELRRRYYGSG